MYIGRFVAGGQLGDSSIALVYRVSSRLFPNRRIAIGEGSASVLPTDETAVTDNPYVSYVCARWTDTIAAVSNGSHTDPIFERLIDGVPAKEAISFCLGAVGYERDDYNTPRVVAVADLERGEMWFGIVAADRLHVQSAPMIAGKLWLLATNELHDAVAHARPVSATSAVEVADDVVAGPGWNDLEYPVAALALKGGVRGWTTALSHP